MSASVPMNVLHKAEGRIVTCEPNTAELHRGKLVEAESSVHCQMFNIAVTYRDGPVAPLEQVCKCGSKPQFLVLPDVLKTAPLSPMAARGRGHGMECGNVVQKQRELSVLKGILSFFFS